MIEQVDNSVIQVSPDGTGKKVRNLETVVIQADGSSATVEVQVVCLMDERGKLVSPSDASWQESVLNELVRIGDALELILQAMVE